MSELLIRVAYLVGTGMEKPPSTPTRIVKTWMSSSCLSERKKSSTEKPKPHPSRKSSRRQSCRVIQCWSPRNEETGISRRDFKLLMDQPVCDPDHPLLGKGDSPVNILHATGVVGNTLQLVRIPMMSDWPQISESNDS